MSTKTVLLVFLVLAVFFIGSLSTRINTLRNNEIPKTKLAINSPVNLPSPSPTVINSPTIKSLSSPSPTQTTLPTASPTNSAFDTSLGNTVKAAKFGSYLLATLLKNSGGNDNFDVYVEEVNVSVFVTIVYDSFLWSDTPESLQKDLVSSFVMTTRSEFPEQVPHVYIKTAGRTAAEGSFSIWSGEPSVKLF